MGLFIQFWAWLFEDKRSAWEQKQDRLAIDAFNKLKNYSVSDRGGLSMDPEELREQVVTGRKELKHLVQPSPNSTTHAHQSTAPLIAHQGHPAQCASRVDDFVEVVTWRRLSSGASARYVCLESLTTKQYAVATADLFSEPLDNLFEGLVAKVNHRVASSITSGEFEWFDTPREAMDAYDANL
ncbi:hypothetical protein ABH905_002077 [Pseudomonas frederiksbergensis]|uniref:hypothetical protein n=1 Tax=Pseudomonas frederiksbergensis TaxID=104087 RepID=UPI003D260F94